MLAKYVGDTASDTVGNTVGDAVRAMPLSMSKSKVKTRVWDPSEHLESEEDIAAYLQAAFEEGDAALIAAALGDIARAKGMSQIARETGLGRESLYKALSVEGNPEFSTILKVVAALGLKLQAVHV